MEGKKAFIYLIKRLNIKPEESVFIDDLEKNVTYAKEVGIHGMVYKNFEQLKTDLTALKIFP